MNTSLSIPGWPRMIAALQEIGVRQHEIGAATGLSQPFISELKSNRRAAPRFEPGLRLYALYQRRVHGLRLALVRAPRKGAPTKRPTARRCA